MKTSRHLRLGVELKVVAAAVISILLLAFALEFYYNRQIEQDAHAAVSRRALAVAISLAGECEPGLRSGNKGLLQHPIIQALAQQDVVSAVVFDERSNLMTSAGRSRLASQSKPAAILARFAKAGSAAFEIVPFAGDVELIYVPVRAGALPDEKTRGDRFLGLVELGVSHASAVYRVQSARLIAQLITLGFAIMAALWCVIVARHTIRPLKGLVAGTEQLAAGHLDARVPAAGNDEIGDLARAFNHMAEALQLSREEILNHQHHLEERVATRTAELKESRDFFDSIIAESPIPMWILNERGYSLMCNKALRALFTIPDEQGAAGVYNILEDPELLERGMMPVVKRAFDHRQTVNFSATYDAAKVHDGWKPATRPQTLDFTLFPLTDAQGQLKNVVVILVDLTHQRQTEAQLRQAEKMAAIGQLGAGIAHELNNPLTGVVGHTELMLQQLEADSPLRKHLEVVEREADRCKQIVLNLLSYTKPAGEGMVLGNLRDVIDSTIALMRHQASLRNIELHIKVSGDLPALRFNVNQMQQVFVNIITNAYDVMPQGGHVYLDCALHGKQVVIKIADTGRGIAEKNLHRIFEPFFTTKENWRSTGLGLTICYKIIEEHGGRISARNRPQGGAEFVIELPVPKKDAAK